MFLKNGVRQSTEIHSKLQAFPLHSFPLVHLKRVSGNHTQNEIKENFRAQ